MSAETDRVERGQLVHDGWDGASVSRYVLHMPCGCRWTRDGRALLRPCKTTANPECASFQVNRSEA